MVTELAMFSAAVRFMQKLYKGVFYVGRTLYSSIFPLSQIFSKVSQNIFALLSSVSIRTKERKWNFRTAVD
jgi:hypothetical protein